MTLRKFDPTVRLTTPTACASCGREMTVGEPVRRTRGIMRHQGGWLGQCCWRHS